MEAGHWYITPPLPPQPVDSEIQMLSTATGQHTYWQTGGLRANIALSQYVLVLKRDCPVWSLTLPPISLCSCFPDLAGGNGKPQHGCCNSRLRNVLDPYIHPLSRGERTHSWAACPALSHSMSVFSAVPMAAPPAEDPTSSSAPLH